MNWTVQIQMNEKLFVRDPQQSDLGKKIIEHSILLIDELGFEAFTFRKLATKIHTSEAGIYRYFDNKHRLLVYLVAWYWRWLAYKITFSLNNVVDPKQKIRKVIKLLSQEVKDDDNISHVKESVLHRIVISEGSKAYLTKHVSEDNQDQLFKPYKELCSFFADIILEFAPHYKYPRTLASTVVEVAHIENFFLKHLPSLTDFAHDNKATKITAFLEHLVFSALGNEP
ncbi:TetR/AcrR family transcriptional regulator [Aridibaculum aurantiacum]|uniref:TetR/AcrR family transcriptional regulator n=1 Tax=Aridibaculum aurantiacum TaxID=2810307 RepID=UPI001A97A384|nr:TetR/AcrR family transcriptional regulator [Aridibaculum aurantiacum]